MKKYFIIFILFISAAHVFAQENLKNEIIAFTDTTELIIRNGRKLLVDKTISGDHKGAISTLNFLKNTVDERYVILYPAEEILFSLANRNFQLFLYNAKNWDSLMEGKVRTIQVESISPELNQYLGDEMPFIRDDLKQSNLNESDKELVDLYIRYYLNDDYADINKLLKKYTKEYPDSEYKNFANQLRNITTTGRLGFCLGYGNEFLNGNFTNNFDSYMQVMNFEMDGFINRLYLSLIAGGSVGKEVAKNDLPVKKKDWIHPAGDKVSTLKYGLKIGRSLYSNEKMNFYPYVFIGGYNVNSQSSLADDDDDDESATLSDAFCPGIGASCDFVLKKWHAKDAYTPNSFMFIRPSVGYDSFLSGKEISKGGDFYFNVSLGISLGDIK